MSTTAVTLFAGPGTLHCAPPLRNGNGNILFRYVVDGTIRTLSNTNSPNKESFKGLLYVPSISDAACNNLTAPYIPLNATRRIDLPADSHDTIGLAPWVSRECTRAYLSASRQDDVQALIFYQPESRDSGKPAPSDSPIWDLGDAGQWKKENDYSVYAIPGTAGTNLMHQLEQYGGHGNGSDAQTIAECARLYALVDLEPDQSSNAPGIWVFILAIMGAIVLMVVFAFITLRHVQRKRRESLQRRLVSGEVDLEYLGIKRLVVPPHILSALPVYVYPGQESEQAEALKEKGTPENASEESNDTEVKVTETEIDSTNTPSSSTLTLVADQQDETLSSILSEILPPATAPTHRAVGKRRRPVSSQTLTLTFSQHTCAICLDDFVAGNSLIRELPCTHIFHPECIDTFLARDGSTCPVCKHSVLPESFVEEQIGALLVRRAERSRRRRLRRRHRHHHHGRGRERIYVGSPVYENQDVPFSPSSTSSSGAGIMDRFRAWLARDYDDERSPGYHQDEEPFGSLEANSHLQRPAPAGIADTNRRSEESYDPERREMMQRRAMMLLGTPVDHRTVPSSNAS